MPDGVMQWFDEDAGEGAVARGGHLFSVVAKDVEAAARRVGARVHFDINEDQDGERAVNVMLGAGHRRSAKSGRSATLVGARGVDTKGAGRFRTSHDELGLSRSSHTLEVATAWGRCLQMRNLDVALSLYASDAVLHNAADDIAGRAHVRTFLEGSGLLGLVGHPHVRGDDGEAVLDWTRVGPQRQPVSVRCRIEHGRITEQWFNLPVAMPSEAAPSEFAEPEIILVTRGDVSQAHIDDAMARLQTTVSHITSPVLMARLKLSLAPDPGLARPALAQVTLDIDGEIVRAHVAAERMHDAIDMLQKRLHDQLQHLASRQLALHRTTGVSEPEAWRHGSLAADRPGYFQRDPDERQLVRHKTFAVGELMPDEAAFDLEQLDYTFYLFRDLASGEDALLERLPEGGYGMTRLHPLTGANPDPAAGSAVHITVDDRAPATMAVSDAVERLTASHEPFVFFANATTGRGNVVHLRYDGHYGLITPDEPRPE